MISPENSERKPKGEPFGPESRDILDKSQKHQDQSALQSNHFSQETTLATPKAQSSVNFNFSGEPFGSESHDVLDKSQKHQDQSAFQSNHFAQETTLAMPKGQSSVNFNFSDQTFGQEPCSSSYSNDSPQSTFHSTNVQFANESWRPPNLTIRPNLYITPPTIPISNNFDQFSGEKKFSLPWHSSYQPEVKTGRTEKTIPDYLRSAFGFKPDDNEELTNAFKIMMPQIKEIFIGTIAKTYIGNRAVAFQIADIVNLGGKVWRNLTKNKKLEHPKWPFLVDKRDVTNRKYYPIELTYTEK
ncbi:hypothetical protein Ddc_18424 [Ditylenchus destructor]|nr:hypothetical protein Ddc_18424 [Ditylenchus destructor]